MLREVVWQGNQSEIDNALPCPPIPWLWPVHVPRSDAVGSSTDLEAIIAAGIAEQILLDRIHRI